MTEPEELYYSQVDDKKYFRDYLNQALAQHLVDGNYNAFSRALGMLVGSKYTLYSFCKKSGLGRARLTQLFDGKTTPRLDTVVRILNVLGYKIKIM